jgi:hypothetical protein
MTIGFVFLSQPTTSNVVWKPSMTEAVGHTISSRSTGNPRNNPVSTRKVGFQQLLAVLASRSSALAAALPRSFLGIPFAIPSETAFSTATSVRRLLITFLTAFRPSSRPSSSPYPFAIFAQHYCGRAAFFADFFRVFLAGAF